MPAEDHPDPDVAEPPPGSRPVGTFVERAGELGVVQAGQAEAAECVTAPRAKGEALVDAAQSEGTALIAAAEADAAKADDTYAVAWTQPPTTRRSAPTAIVTSAADAATEHVAYARADADEHLT